MARPGLKTLNSVNARYVEPMDEFAPTLLPENPNLPPPPHCTGLCVVTTQPGPTDQVTTFDSAAQYETQLCGRVFDFVVLSFRGLGPTRLRPSNPRAPYRAARRLHTTGNPSGDKNLIRQHNRTWRGFFVAWMGPVPQKNRQKRRCPLPAPLLIKIPKW